MKALALETSADRLAVGGVGEVGGDSGVGPVERHVAGARKHAAMLFPLIREVLDELGLSLEELDGLAVADGPGSFTGLRVGAAAVKALARANPRLTVWTASTLMVRAVGVAPPHGARVLVVSSALRGELYAASYRVDLPRRVETLLSPSLATPESLHRETPDLVVAHAPEKLLERLADQFAVPLVHGDAAWPRASALLSLLEVEGGACRVAAIENWEPSYGRPAEAQVRWEALHGQPLSHPSGVAR